jgi:hypothetical protein
VLEESFGENSPNQRQSGTLFTSVNHAFPKLGGAIEGSYRLYSDTYGIIAHTFEVSWLQHVGSRLILEPLARFYQQSAARFYYYDLDSTSIVPVHTPMGTGPYYTSDFRLSAERDDTYGLKATVKVTERLQIVAAYERFAMYGRDGITPASAYPRAGISTVGVKFSW